MNKKESWAIFNQIAASYDLLNFILSLGIDRLWRRRLGKALPLDDQLLLLDLGTGTGDIVFSLWRQFRYKFRHIVGLDLSRNMLEKAKLKTPNGCPVVWQYGDACALPFEDDSFHVITMAFAIRNVPDPDLALREISRVLKKNGKVLILEFSIPESALVRWAYLIYLRKLLPAIGGWVSGNKDAYIYLNKTIETFPYGKDLVEKMGSAGLANSQFTPLNFGIVSLYEGRKT